MIPFSSVAAAVMCIPVFPQPRCIAMDKGMLAVCNRLITHSSPVRASVTMPNVLVLILERIEMKTFYNLHLDHVIHVNHPQSSGGEFK